MQPFLIALLIAGAVVLAAGVALIVRARFERFVGIRYLTRRRQSKVAGVGIVVAALVTGSSLAAMFLAGKAGLRTLETIAVIFALLGGLGVMLFLLLRVFSVFTTVSTMGVVLGVASLVVVLAVTSGFEREFQDKVLSVNSHMLIRDYGEPEPEQADRDADAHMKKLLGLPGLRTMAKFSLSAGEVMIGKVGANLKGVDLERGGAELSRWLVAGSIDALGKTGFCPARPSMPGLAPATDGDSDDPKVGHIVLGEELARRLRVKVGDCVNVTIPIPTGGDLTAPPPWYRFKVAALSRMGFNEYDTRLAFLSLADARRASGKRGVIFGLELRFDTPHRALEAEPEVEARLGSDLQIINWRELNHNLFMALTMQKTIIALFLVLIIVVAAFNIMASLTMIVLSKIREIAILAGMGARRGALSRLFLVSGSFMGFVGTGLGTVFGLGVCAMARIYGYPLDPKVYLIEKLPVQISVTELIVVAAATQLICCVATLYPAARASRLKVVDGLRAG